MAVGQTEAVVGQTVEHTQAPGVVAVVFPTPVTGETLVEPVTVHLVVTAAVVAPAVVGPAVPVVGHRAVVQIHGSPVTESVPLVVREGTISARRTPQTIIELVIAIS